MPLVNIVLLEASSPTLARTTKVSHGCMKIEDTAGKYIEKWIEVAMREQS